MTLTRIAVPIFFVISGFFYEPNRNRRLISKILIYLLIANIVFFLLHLGISFLQGNVGSYIKLTFTRQNAIDFVIFNESPFHVHLWYLGAILYVYVFAHLFEKMLGNYSKAQDLMILATPFLLILDLIFGKYSILFFGHEFKAIYVRNWLFVGIPYFSIGSFLRMKKETIEAKLIGLGKARMLFFVVLFTLTTFLEHYLLNKAGANATRDHYFSTTMLAITIFCFFLIFVNNEGTLISDIGKRDSTLVYIIHPLFIIIIDALLGSFNVPGYYFFRPFAVFGTSIFGTELFFRIMKRQR